MRASIILIWVGILTGCASLTITPELERRRLQTRVFQRTTLSTVHRAFQRVLQNEGYILKKQDPARGILVGMLPRFGRRGQKEVGEAWKPYGDEVKELDPQESIEVVVNLALLERTTVEARLTVQRVAAYAFGGQRGEEFILPQVYQHFYRKVTAEIARVTPVLR